MKMSIYGEPFIGKLESVYGGCGVKVGDIGYSAGSYDVDEHNRNLGTVCHGLLLGSYQLFQVCKGGSHIARIIPIDKIVVLPEDNGLSPGWEWLDCIRQVMNDYDIAMNKRQASQKEFEERWRLERECQFMQASSNAKT